MHCDGGMSWGRRICIFSDVKGAAIAYTVPIFVKHCIGFHNKKVKNYDYTYGYCPLMIRHLLENRICCRVEIVKEDMDFKLDPKDLE